MSGDNNPNLPGTDAISTTTPSPNPTPSEAVAGMPDVPPPPPPEPTGADGTAATSTLEIVFSKTLTLEIPRSEGPPPSLPSSSSSTTPSSSGGSSPIGGPADSTAHTSPMTSSNTTTESCTSLSSASASASASSPATTAAPTPTLNVRFAPLPELAPRKRRSSVPLGMAARSQLVRRRRGYHRDQQHHNQVQQNGNGYYHQQQQHHGHHHHHHQPDPEPGPQYGASTHPMWTEEELAEARARQVQVAMERERKRREAAEAGGGDPNDAFVAFAAKVKDASRQIWKKVSKKDMKDAKEGGGVKGKGSVDNLKRGEGEGVGRGMEGGSTASLVEGGEGARRSGGEDGLGPSKPSTPVEMPLKSILVSSSFPSPPVRPLPDPPQHDEEEEAGGVWEEEIDPHFPLNANQSESSFDSLSSSKSGSNRRSVWAVDFQPPELQLTGIPDLHPSSSTEDCTTPTKTLSDDDPSASTPTIVTTTTTTTTSLVSVSAS